MTLIPVAVIAVAALAFVLAPLRRAISGRPLSAGWRRSDDREALLAQRDALYRTLRDLDFDRRAVAATPTRLAQHQSVAADRGAAHRRITLRARFELRQ